MAAGHESQHNGHDYEARNIVSMQHVEICNA